MRKSVVFLFLLSLVLIDHSFGQTTVMEIEMKAGKAQHVFSASDAQGNLAYIFQGTRSIQISIANASYVLTKEYLIKREEADKRNEIIGVTLNEKTIVVYLYDSKERNFASLVVARDSGGYKFNPSIGTLNKTDYLLKSFEMEGVFYSMVVPQYKNVFVLLSSLEGAAFVSKTHEVPFPTLYAKLSSKNDELNQKTDLPVGIEKIAYDMESTIKSAYPTKKMYTFDNKIYLTFEEPSLTHLVIIDPNGSATYRKLNFTLDKDKNGKETVARQGNSFLYKGDLFRVTYNNSQLNLLVININSMELLKSYNVFPEQDIDFMNGPIKEDGNDISDRILKNTHQFFKKIHRGKLAVAINELNNEEYRMEIGAYEEVTTYRNTGMGGSPLSSGVSIGLGFGGLGMGYGGLGGFGGFGNYPGYSPYGGGYATTSTRTSYFQSLLKIQDLSHLEGNVPRTIHEKINAYEKEVLKNNSPELLNVVSVSNGLLLGHYLKGKSKYILVEFVRRKE